MELGTGCNMNTKKEVKSKGGFTEKMKAEI